MKANELMIGDWLQYHDCNLEKQCYAQVTSIQADGTEPYIQTSDSDVYYLAETYRPIPLTPEILEKNEFKIYEQDFTSRIVYKFGSLDYMEYEEYHKYFNIGCEITYKHFGREITYIHSLMRIQYVHELQHALKLCGIDKTIEL